MLPDRYPSKYHPEGHRPKSRRELHDEVMADLRAYDAPINRAGGQGRARSGYREDDSGSRQDDRRHRSRTRTGRSQHESIYPDNNNKSRADSRGRSRAGTRQSGSEQRSRSRTVTGRGRTRTATKLFNHLTPEKIPARSRTSIRVSDRERDDRRTANPPLTSHTASKGSRMDYFRWTQPATSMAPSRAPTGVSTLHPDDSASNGTYESRDRRRRESKPEVESRGRPRAPTTTSRTQYDTYRDYPPTPPMIPSSRSSQRQSQRELSPSITHAFARNPLDPRMTYTHNPQQAAPAAATAASRASASRASRASSPPHTVAHPHGWDPVDQGETHIWRAGEKSRRYEAPTHRSQAPTHRSQASTHRSEAPTHRSDAPTHRSSTSRRSEAAPTHRSEAPTHHSSTSRRSDAPTHRSEAPTHRSSTSRRSSAAPPTTHHSSTSRRPSEQPSTYRPSIHSEAPTRHPSRYGPILIPCRLIPRDSLSPPPSAYRTEIRTPQSATYGDGGHGGPGVGRSVRFSSEIYERSASSWTGTEDEVEFLEARLGAFSLRR